MTSPRSSHPLSADHGASLIEVSVTFVIGVVVALLLVALASRVLGNAVGTSLDCWTHQGCTQAAVSPVGT